MKSLRRFPLLLLGCASIAVGYAEQGIPQEVRPPALFGVIPAQNEQPGEGAVVGQVLPGGTGAAIGLRDGDVIFHANGVAIATTSDIVELARSLNAGDPVALRVRRGTELIELSGIAVAPTVQLQGGSPASGQGPFVSGQGAGPTSPRAGNAAGTPPPPGARSGIGDRPIDAQEARETAHELAHELERYYVFPETGLRYAAAIRANAERGVYGNYRSSAALAERFSADLREVAPDNHLRVQVGAPDAPRPSYLAANPPPPRPAGRGRMVALPMENSLGEPRWLAPGVAYLRINSFAGDEAQLATLRKFMMDHVTARTIIFDLRANGGGGFEEIDVMFPYFFKEPTTLAMLDTRDAADPISFTRLLEGPTLKRVADIPGYVRREHRIEPHPTETRLQEANLYVLTSNETRSSGEHFAMALKHTGRGTLIGETTAGAGHTTMMRMLGGGFAVAVPVGHTVDPNTGKGWEGTGIEPDVKVPSGRALVEALERSGVPKAQAARISAELDASSPAAAP